MISKEGLTLEEFYKHLTEYIDRHKQDVHQDWKAMRVSVRIDNPSVGPCATTAITGFSTGFDWDSGTFFLRTAEPVYHAQPITYKEIEEHVKMVSDIYTKPERQWLPKQRKHCFEVGLKEGIKTGIYMRFPLEKQEITSPETPVPREDNGVEAQSTDNSRT